MIDYGELPPRACRDVTTFSRKAGVGSEQRKVQEGPARRAHMFVQCNKYIKKRRSEQRKPGGYRGLDHVQRGLREASQADSRARAAGYLQRVCVGSITRLTIVLRGVREGVVERPHRLDHVQRGVELGQDLGEVGPTEAVRRVIRHRPSLQ